MKTEAKGNHSEKCRYEKDSPGKKDNIKEEEEEEKDQ